jgi:hypothetical protein
MTCAEARLDEYMDGELAEAERREVEVHLSGCAGCREELDRSRRLERLLLSVPEAGKAPDAERFLGEVRSRSRRPFGWGAAAAAAVLLGVLAFLLPPRGHRQDALEAVAAYAEKPSTTLEDAVRAAGPEGMRAVESCLGHRDVRVQFAAATLLFKLGDAATRDRVLAQFQKRGEPDGGWELSDPGVEREDVELVQHAINLAVDGERRVALDVLRRLHRLNRAAHEKIIDAAVTLLKSDSTRIQKLALDIVKELDIEFPLSAIVDLLDSPELGDQALKVLREATRQDFGRDKEAWRTVVRQKEKP